MNRRRRSYLTDDEIAHLKAMSLEMTPKQLSYEFMIAKETVYRYIGKMNARPDILPASTPYAAALDHVFLRGSSSWKNRRKGVSARSR